MPGLYAGYCERSQILATRQTPSEVTTQKLGQKRELKNPVSSCPVRATFQPRDNVVSRAKSVKQEFSCG